VTSEEDWDGNKLAERLSQCRAEPPSTDLEPVAPLFTTTVRLKGHARVVDPAGDARAAWCTHCPCKFFTKFSKKIDFNFSVRLLLLMKNRMQGKTIPRHCT
jgi:hypothetical protein